MDPIIRDVMVSMLSKDKDIAPVLKKKVMEALALIKPKELSKQFFDSMTSAFQCALEDDDSPVHVAAEDAATIFVERFMKNMVITYKKPGAKKKS